MTGMLTKTSIPQHNQMYDNPRATESTSMLHSNVRFESPSAYRFCSSEPELVGVLLAEGTAVIVDGTAVGVSTV